MEKAGGGEGYADVWKRGHFGWEYKGKRKSLKEAYQQLLQYKDDLENPPLLVVCDLEQFQIHTNFTGTVKRTYSFGLADLAENAPLPDTTLRPLEVLDALFTDPERLRPDRTSVQVTEEAAAEFAKLAGIRVLDPACGSGNFLYVALKLLMDLEKEVISFATVNGVQGFFPQVGPEQLHGIEVNAYAHELAQVVIWIGYIQWLHDNGFGIPSSPILKPLDNVLRMDAVLAHDGQGRPLEPEWPEADVIVGNPPFLGGKKLRTGLGDDYVEDLFALYEGRVPREADLVCYWFERARALIAEGR